MATTKGGLLAKNKTAVQQQGMNISAMLNSYLERDGFKRRFDELLGARAPQFVSSMVTLINADDKLKQCFNDAPLTIIQACLKAATYDLPIDPNLGYAYIVPFNNTINGTKRMEATFIMGYKGMHQLACRSGVYQKINVLDVREGELVSFNRLTEDIEFDWIQDEEERNSRKIIGYVGYYRLVNGMEKTIFMSKQEVINHELKFRKGQYMGKGWRQDFDAMALKTVYRKLIGKWGVMSIDYKTKPTPGMVAMAQAIATGDFDDEEKLIEAEAPNNVDMETGEILSDMSNKNEEKVKVDEQPTLAEAVDNK